MTLSSRQLRARLREDWSGPATIQQLASRYGISSETVRSVWKRDKDAGLLPKGSPRPYFRRETAIPHFIKQTSLAKPFDPVESEAVEIDDRDDLDPVDEDADDSFAAEFNADAADESLAVMRRVHPDLDHPAAQTAPATWLRFDRKGEEPPTSEQLRAMCRALDQQGTSR